MVQQVKRLVSRFGAYRLHYLMSRTRALGERAPSEFDVVFVLLPAWRNWILHAICREIATRLEGSVHFHFSVRDLPPARCYIFGNQTIVPDVLVHNPVVWRGRRFAWFTHPSDVPVSPEQYIYALKQLDGIFFNCSMFRDELTQAGLDPHSTWVLLAGADPQRFQRRERTGTGLVGFCTAYYERKDPDRLAAVVRAMPHRNFKLMGRHWDQYPRFSELAALPNFSYSEAPYDEYPAFYADLDVFVSVSKLEGGPVPLLEAMMSNVVPVASRTGLAPDVIVHGDNGFVFDTDAPVAKICEFIDQAYAIRSDIRRTVEHLTWDRLALAVKERLSHARP